MRVNFGPSFIKRPEIVGVNAVSELQPMNPEDRKVSKTCFSADNSVWMPYCSCSVLHAHSNLINKLLNLQLHEQMISAIKQLRGE